MCDLLNFNVIAQLITRVLFTNGTIYIYIFLNNIEIKALYTMKVIKKYMMVMNVHELYAHYVFIVIT